MEALSYNNGGSSFGQCVLLFSLGVSCVYLRKNISGTYASMWVGEGGCRARMFKTSGQCMFTKSCELCE